MLSKPNGILDKDQALLPIIAQSSNVYIRSASEQYKVGVNLVKCWSH